MSQKQLQRLVVIENAVARASECEGGGRSVGAQRATGEAAQAGLRPFRPDLEGRGPVLTLLGLIDDATGKVPAAHFQIEHENSAGYLHLLRGVVEGPGIPLALYRLPAFDSATQRRPLVAEEQLAGQQLPTPVGRALEEVASKLSWPVRRKPRAVSSACGAPFRTVWLANCAWPKPPRSSKPMRCWRAPREE